MNLYTYRARYRSNYDGDTVRLDIDLGFGVWLHNQSVRLLGIDCPELHGTDSAAGKLAQQATAAMLTAAGQEIVVQTYRDTHDKYGRWLADIYFGVTVEAALGELGEADRFNLAECLRAAGHVKGVVRG
jgi:micrococcal nuclease